MDWTILSNFIAIIVSISAVLIAWRKLPIEQRQGESSAAGQITDGALVLLVPLRQRVEELERGMKDKDRLIEALEKRVKILEDEIEKKDAVISFEQSSVSLYKNWVDRLCDQIKRLGAVPAKMKNGDE